MLLDSYLQLRPTLVRYFAVKLNSTAAAEDVVQEIYLRIVNVPAGEVVQDSKAWLFRVGANILIDTRRSAVRSAARDQAWAEEGGTSAVAGAERMSAEPSAEAVVAGRQRLNKLLAQVDALPPRMAQAFRLHKLEGLSQAETARRMGVSIKAVEKHLTGALQRLMQELSANGAEL